MAKSAKPLFAPLPARAAADPGLSGLQLRTLAVIAVHDRMGRNGQGCWASLGTLAGILQCDYSRLSDSMRRLRERGYISTTRHPTNRRLLVHHVIYTESDALLFGKQSSSARSSSTDTLPSGKAPTADSLPDSLPPFSASTDQSTTSSPKEIRRDSAEAVKRNSAEAACPATRSTLLLSSDDKPLGETVAIIERSLLSGSNEYRTLEVAEWLLGASDGSRSGTDPVAGRAHRLLQEYEFPALAE